MKTLNSLPFYLMVALLFIGMITLILRILETL